MIRLNLYETSVRAFVHLPQELAINQPLGLSPVTLKDLWHVVNGLYMWVCLVSQVSEHLLT